MNKICWYISVKRLACQMAALLLILVCTAVPAEALRVIGTDGTNVDVASPQTVFTIYNETDREISLTYMPVHEYNDRVFKDIEALSNLYENQGWHRIKPKGKLEYVGLLGANPWISNKQGYIGEYGFGIHINEQKTEFRLWLHGEQGFNGYSTTPYDLDWSAGGHQENVGSGGWLIESGQTIPGTKNLKTMLEDRVLRAAVHSALDNKWYIVTLLLGHRANGTIKSEPAHLVMVFQEANEEMTQ